MSGLRSRRTPSTDPLTCLKATSCLKASEAAAIPGLGVAISGRGGPRPRLRRRHVRECLYFSSSYQQKLFTYYSSNKTAAGGRRTSAPDTKKKEVRRS